MLGLGDSGLICDMLWSLGCVVVRWGGGWGGIEDLKSERVNIRDFLSDEKKGGEVMLKKNSGTRS